jgi:uncharacterized membrane protein
MQRQKLPTLSQAKTLGGVGSILALLTIVPTVGWVLACVGLILTLIAVKYISEIVGDRKIFNNMLIGVILAIVGVAVAAIVIVGVLFSFFGLGLLSGGVGTYGSHPYGTTVLPSDFLGVIAAVAIALAIVWIAYVISAVFIRRSYSSIAKHVNVNLFGTAALLYLIGAALIIILVGFILIFVAQILLIVAFFSLPDQLPQQTTTATSTYSPPPPPMSSS